MKDFSQLGALVVADPRNCEMGISNTELAAAENGGVQMPSQLIVRGNYGGLRYQKVYAIRVEWRPVVGSRL